MLWTKVEKERLKRAYHARMSRAISGLEAMDISGLSQVYCAVAAEDRELIRSGGRAIGIANQSGWWWQIPGPSGACSARWCCWC